MGKLDATYHVTYCINTFYVCLEVVVNLDKSIVLYPCIFKVQTADIRLSAYGDYGFVALYDGLNSAFFNTDVVRAYLGHL